MIGDDGEKKVLRLLQWAAINCYYLQFEASSNYLLLLLHRQIRQQIRARMEARSEERAKQRWYGGGGI